MQPKYKTERHLRARVYELATQNKKLLDMLSFNLQDLETGTEEGISAEDCKILITRTLKVIEEIQNGASTV